MNQVRGFVAPGVSRKVSPWLIIPLAKKYHTGDEGIDNGLAHTTETWEAQFGTQVEHLDRLSQILGFNLWHRAGIPRSVEEARC